MSQKKHLPVLQGTRVINMQTAFVENTLTAYTRTNAEGDQGEIIMDLSRPEHQRARDLLGQLSQELLKWKEEAGEKNCGTCKGSCCTSVWDNISLTEADAQRLADHIGTSLKTLIEVFLEEANSYTDDRFKFRFKPNKNSTSGKSCPFLHHSPEGVGRCGVYEARPRVCREFNAYACTLHERAPGLK